MKLFSCFSCSNIRFIVVDILCTNVYIHIHTYINNVFFVCGLKLYLMQGFYVFCGNISGNVFECLYCLANFFMKGFFRMLCSCSVAYKKDNLYFYLHCNSREYNSCFQQKTLIFFSRVN